MDRYANKIRRLAGFIGGGLGVVKLWFETSFPEYISLEQHLSDIESMCMGNLVTRTRELLLSKTKDLATVATMISSITR